VRNVALLGTPIQMALTMALGFGMAWAGSLGWETVPSPWLGALVSLSSPGFPDGRLQHKTGSFLAAF